MHNLIDYKNDKEVIIMICLSKVSKAKVSRARSIQWVRHNVEQKSYSTGFCTQLCTARIPRYLQHCFLILPQNHLTVGRYVPKSCLNTARIRNLEDQHLYPLRDPCKRCAQSTAKINWSMKLWALYKNIQLDTIYITALYYHTPPWSEKHKLNCLLNFRDSNLHLYNCNALKQIETICM